MFKKEKKLIKKRKKFLEADELNVLTKATFKQSLTYKWIYNVSSYDRMTRRTAS